MSDWRPAFRERLAQGIFLRPLVAERVRHGWRPQGDEMPAVTFMAVATSQGHTLEEADGLPSVRIQVDSWATTAENAAEVAEAVRLTLDGFRGMMQPGDVFVQSLFMEDGGRDEYLPPQSGQGRGVHRVTQDFALSYEQTVPTF